MNLEKNSAIGAVLSVSLLSSRVSVSSNLSGAVSTKERFSCIVAEKIGRPHKSFEKRDVIDSLFDFIIEESTK